MLKGVNRQVVEVSQPESAYFERVLFFVKPEYYGLSESKLKLKANTMLKDDMKPPHTKYVGGKNGRVLYFIKMTAAALAGSALTAMLGLLQQ